MNRAVLAEAVRARVAGEKPGAALPTDRTLAEQSGLSVRTVVSVMKELLREGLVVRVRGKGTFVAGGEAVPAFTAPRGTAAENLADFVYGSIRSGELRRGRALPSVKYLSRQLKVTPATVIAAYRLLQQRADIVRIGKTYWYGDYHSLVHPRTRKEVYVYLADDSDRERVFRNPTHGAMYHTMEEVLSSSGYLVRYAMMDTLPKDVSRWERGAFPFGMVLSMLNADGFASRRSVLERIRRTADRHALPILIHWDGGDFRPAMRMGEVVYRLGMTGYQFLARHLVEQGCRGARFFIDADHLLDNEYRFWVVWDFLHLRAEVLHLNPAFHWRLSIIDPTGSFSWDNYPYRFGPAHIARIASVYTPTSHEDVMRDIDITTDLARTFDLSRKAGMWVFQKDAHAAEALVWANAVRMAVPDRLQIISLDDDPACHHLGLTRCELDWEGLGYLMAHAIIGDFSVPHTDEGVIRARARVVGKLTTR